MAARLTQEELAERSGLSARAISDMERGRRSRPYRRSVGKLAAALELSQFALAELATAAGLAPPALAPPADRVGYPAGHGPADPAGAPGTAGPPGTAGVSSASRPLSGVPRQLPAAVGHFVGREAELKALNGLLDQACHGGAVVISAIEGTAGVGKTALAVHWAHQVAERFPDGQLYVNLRGYDPDQPMPAAEALAGFLRALGVARPDIPVEVAERAAWYRSLLAGRRMLVVADNAGSVEQVRSLLPGTPGCVAVVTSRDSLAGLVARDGAQRLDLDLLPSGEAVGLLRALIGGRVDADLGAAAALAGQCSRLPLALRVAAELAVARPSALLADLVGYLADQQQRLDLLDAGGDPRTAVRAVFSWSYRSLDARAARAFRLLGLHPGPDLDRYAAAALTGSTLEQAGHVLDELARAHLIQAARGGRYAMHDLLRAYAPELAADQERRAALTRLFDHYLHTAAAAMDTLFPAERHRRPRVPRSATPAPPVGDPAAARAWLDAERAILVASAAYAAAHGWSAHATHLAATLFRYLEGGHDLDAVTIHSHARYAAAQAGDRIAEATALNDLGLADFRQGRCEQAASLLQQAVALSREAGDQTGEARALGNLSLVDFQRGRSQEATGCLRQALAIFHETGDRTSEARALGSLGLADLRQGRCQQATSHFHQALALFRGVGDRTGEAHALSGLGLVSSQQSRFREASKRLQQALTLFRETGDRSGEAYALSNLGDVHRRQGRSQPATRHHEQALTLFREIRNQAGEAKALNGLGEVLLGTGHPEQARTQHTSALALARRIADQHQQARAHHGLAHVYQATGDPGPARQHWHEALTRYSDLGVPEADQVRAQLAATDNHDHRVL